MVLLVALYAIYINRANGYFFTGKTNMGFSIDLRLKELRKEIGRMLNYICMHLHETKTRLEAGTKLNGSL